MPEGSRSAEVTAIEGAYQDRVRTLYTQLATNLGDAPVTHRTEQQCVDQFKTGLNVAKRARQLALDAVGAEMPAIASLAAKPKEGITGEVGRLTAVRRRDRARAGRPSRH